MIMFTNAEIDEIVSLFPETRTDSVEELSRIVAKALAYEGLRPKMIAPMTDDSGIAFLFSSMSGTATAQIECRKDGTLMARFALVGDTNGGPMSWALDKDDLFEDMVILRVFLQVPERVLFPELPRA